MSDYPDDYSQDEILTTERIKEHNTILSKKDLLSSINQSKIPPEIEREFWHFSSPILSNSFVNPKDEFENEQLSWVLVELSLQNKPLREITPPVMQNLLQVHLHGKTRVSQARGRLRDNLITLLTKAIQVVEARNEEQKPKFKLM